MKSFIIRVIEEKDELDDKIAKLKDFLFGDVYPTLSKLDQVLLATQYQFMTGYSFTLQERILNYKIEQ